ncbi:MAG TPA: hypothetical protein VGJ09_11720 [Bryobacteraceae bacterium]|jgi:hypothetical protein
MTKVTLHYTLERKLAEDDFANVAAVQSVYGMARVALAPSLDKVTVDYDASRLKKDDVEAALARYGIPIAHRDAAL